MDFWTRVDIQDADHLQTATGNVRLTPWTTVAHDVEARVLPLAVEEGIKQWATPEEDAYEIQLRGAWSIRPRMRVLVGSMAYDIRNIIQPPPFGTPTTVLQTVRVTP